MGDDCEAPHKLVKTLPSFADPADLVRHTSQGYLPLFSGSGHSWDCKLNGLMIATIDSSGVTAHVRDVEYIEYNNLHFAYNSAMA